MFVRFLNNKGGDFIRVPTVRFGALAASPVELQVVAIIYLDRRTSGQITPNRYQSCE
jgi:hypothetical protein